MWNAMAEARALGASADATASGSCALALCINDSLCGAALCRWMLHKMWVTDTGRQHTIVRFQPLVGAWMADTEWLQLSSLPPFSFAMNGGPLCRSCLLVRCAAVPLLMCAVSNKWSLFSYRSLLLFRIFCSSEYFCRVIAVWRTWGI